MSYLLYKERVPDSIKVEKKLEDDFLVFSYADGTKDEYQIYEPENGDGLRYILVKNTKIGYEKYYLVEKVTYIEEKLKKNDYSFQNHIFLEETDFRNITFSERVDFMDAVFTQDADFMDAVFKLGAYFINTIFMQKAYFINAAFIEEVFFGRTIFTEATRFVDAIFEKRADFRSVTFIREVFFGRATFAQNSNFSGGKFTQIADFNNVTCKQGVELLFGHATFSDYFILNPSNNSEEFTLSLENTFIDVKKFYINKKLVETVGEDTNRVTYTILKDALLNRNDKIAALEMHKKEFAAHRCELKKQCDDKHWFHFCNWGDRLILWFESWSSNFGTSVGRALFYWLVVYIVFALCILIVLTNVFVFAYAANYKYELLDVVLYSIRILPISEFKVEFLQHLTLSAKITLYFLVVLKTIFLSIMTYEIIKSFRKFSRLKV